MSLKPAWKLWIFLAIALVVAFVLVPQLGGMLLNEHHIISSRILLSESPENVWRAISDLAATPDWYPNVVSEERLADRNGHQVWRERYHNGQSLVLETAESCPPYRLMRAAIEGNTRESWEFDLQPTPTGTELRITESGDIPNPFMRFVSKYLMGHFKGVNNYERALALRFDQPAHIENMREVRQMPVMRSLNGTEQPCRMVSVTAAR
jgi:uncharacterized protein YndB with AHSA1/START domain